MVNHINISAGESIWRVQLASLSLGEIKQHLIHFHCHDDHRLTLGLTPSIALAKHIRGFLNILLITHNDCFPKFCEAVITLHEELGQVKGLYSLTPIS